MNDNELMRRAQISYRYDLAETPTLQRIRQVFYDLYAQARLDPEYLFMAAHDQAMLRRQIIECTNRYPWPPEYLLDVLVTGAFRLPNEVTGKLVHVVVLPGLECGSVIVGFFR